MEPHSTFSTRWSIISGLHGQQHEAMWLQFIRRYRDYVTAVLRRVGLPKQQVDGAVEEFWGYLYASRAAERADRDGRFRSYLSGILRNYARKWRRDHLPDAARGADAPCDEVPALSEEPGLELWAAQIVQLGLASLGQSHADDERILRWFFGIPAGIDDAPVARLGATAIAARLGRSPNAVHQALFRARSRLRRRVEEEVALTVTESPELREELGVLFGALDRTNPGLSETGREAP